jgi:hypothetical protein
MAYIPTRTSWDACVTASGRDGVGEFETRPYGYGAQYRPANGQELASGSRLVNGFSHNGLLEGDIEGIIGMSWRMARKKVRKVCEVRKVRKEGDAPGVTRGPK